MARRTVRLTIIIPARHRAARNDYFRKLPGNDLVQFDAVLSADGITPSHYIASGHFTVAQANRLKHYFGRYFTAGTDYDLSEDEEPRKLVERKRLKPVQGRRT